LTGGRLAEHVRGADGEAAGVGAADVDFVHREAGPADQRVAGEYRRDHQEVVHVGGACPRVVGDESVPLLETDVVLEIAHHRFRETGQAQRQPRHVDAHEQALAFGGEQRAVEILGLVDDRRSGELRGDAPLLVVDHREPVTQHLERDRIDGRGGHGELLVQFIVTYVTG